MYIVLIGTISILALLIFLHRLLRDKIQFYAVGLDEGFTPAEITTLLQLARHAGVEEPLSLYISLPTLNGAITRLIDASNQSRDEGERTRTQALLSKLYDYRTKVQLAHENKRGVESTRYLNAGQRVRIVLKGSGVFSSSIVNNGRELIIRTPTKDGIITLSGAEWVGKTITVYLWRKGDAHYVFDTRVTAADVFNGVPAIHLAQTGKLLRTQKRRSVRCQCELPAKLYFLQAGEEVNYNAVETGAGYRCLLEDISEDGALIRVGGRGASNANIQLQFSLNGTLVLMFGVVRAVEYSSSLNQSRLHFECMHVSPEMRNLILSFVYKVLPQSEKDALEALVGAEADADSATDAEAPDGAATAGVADAAPDGGEPADSSAVPAPASGVEGGEGSDGTATGGDIAQEAAAFVAEARATLASGAAGFAPKK